MFGIFLRSIRDKKWTLLAFYGTGLFFAWIYASLNDSVQASQASVSEFVKNLPPALNKAFGMDPRTFNTFEGYVGSKQFSLMWPVLLISFLAGISASFIATEVEKGTIELSLAQPISRAKIFLSKLLSGIAANILYIVFTVFSYIPVAFIYDVEFSVKSFLLLGIVGFFFGLGIFGISMMFSSFSSDKGKALFATSGVFIVMYVGYLLALLNDKLDKVKYLSMFYYFDYVGLLLDRKISANVLPVYISIFLLFSLIGLFWFKTRDVAA